MVYAGVVDAAGTRALLVGADGEEPLQAADRAEGRAYLFDATTGTLLRTLYVPDPTGRARFGAAVESGDDVDGDGLDDLFVGAPESTPSGGPSYAGRVFAFSGATGELVFELSSPNGATGGRFGAALAPLLDVNGDGLTDLAVAAPDEPVGARGARGRAYVFGQPIVPEVTVETLRPTTAIAIPASGGSVEVKNRLRNVGTLTATVETWGVLRRPNGSTALAAGVKSVTLLPGDPVGRRKTLELPAAAAAGTYVFTRYVGTYPNEVLASASYTFTKASALSPVPLAVAGRADAGLDAAGVEAGGVAWVDEGTFTVPGEEAAEEALTTGVPLETALRAVSPNPASDRVALRYDLAAAAAVRVTVYDALGRLVAVVADGAHEAGRYEASVDGSRLAPGVYVVRLAAGPFTATERLTVVR